jgi:protein tyrosine phosphatase (PTP) superfamily phosphohydrolase (DUF442 family)
MKIVKFLFFFGLFFLTLNFYLKAPKKILGEEIYISSQPSKEEISNFIRKYKIKSVINLRGENIDEGWYREEKDILKKEGALFFNLKLSKDKDFPRREAIRFLNIFEKIKYPLLIHCKDGFDRSYFFSKLFLKLKEKDLNERYFFKTKIFDFFNVYNDYLRDNNFNDNSKSLRIFIEKFYVPDDFRYSLFIDKENGITKNEDFLSFKVKVINESKKIWILKNNLKEGIRLGVKVFGPFNELPNDLEIYFYENEGKGIDIVRAGIEDGKVYPNQSRVFEFSFKAPKDKGFYFLAIDMVNELKYWFYYYGKAPKFYCFKIF